MFPPTITSAQIIECFQLCSAVQVFFDTGIDGDFMPSLPYGGKQILANFLSNLFVLSIMEDNSKDIFPAIPVNLFKVTLFYKRDSNLLEVIRI